MNIQIKRVRFGIDGVDFFRMTELGPKRAQPARRAAELCPGHGSRIILALQPPANNACR